MYWGLDNIFINLAERIPGNIWILLKFYFYKPYTGCFQDSVFVFIIALYQTKS